MSAVLEIDGGFVQDFWQNTDDLRNGPTPSSDSPGSSGLGTVAEGVELTWPQPPSSPSAAPAPGASLRQCPPAAAEFEPILDFDQLNPHRTDYCPVMKKLGQLLRTAWKRLLTLRMVAWSPVLVVAMIVWWIVRWGFGRRRARSAEVRQAIEGRRAVV